MAGKGQRSGDRWLCAIEGWSTTVAGEAQEEGSSVGCGRSAVATEGRSGSDVNGAEEVAATLLCAGGEEGSNVGPTVGSRDRRRVLKRRGGRWRLGNDSGKGGKRGSGQVSEDCARQRIGKGNGGVGKGNQRWRGRVVGGDESWQVWSAGDKEEGRNNSGGCGRRGGL
ncbi:hypothetical protein BHM03_00023268 [Ensete ventricosum]|nr:hypothetical protein BHM03_00023268 [Ensete ventricosum]